MDAARFVASLRADRLAGDVEHVEEIAERAARHSEMTLPLDPRLHAALDARGLLPLYTHQAQAADAALSGQDVALATPTASGKSLCYHVPVAQTMLTNPSACALYLFPTKALTQDQLRGLRGLLPPKLASRVAIFDGDTPMQERSGIRRSAQVVFTNPDMVHVGMLPRHSGWARLLRSLRYVVIDEMHVYRGVFGSHVANVLRRLRRLCRRYGSDPVFILCSATIANPGELAERLVGKPVKAIEENGAPHGAKHFVFWNPPLNPEGVRGSAGNTASSFLDMLVRQETRSLVFVRSRRQAEVVCLNAARRLERNAPELARRVHPYRGSYLPEDRRKVEQRMLNGDLTGVVATNALELGIDIGGLDATVLTGYPGSVASTWQQAGRSGRTSEGSLSILVAQDDPIDQYIMRHPAFIFGRSHEHARIQPDNPYLLDPHLLAAAYEMPLSPDDDAFYGPAIRQAVAALVDQGALAERDGRWFITPEIDYPAAAINIRSMTRVDYTVAESRSGRVMEHVDEYSAFSQLHPGAVYLHLGESYVVESLDLDAHIASLRRGEPAYYTNAHVVIDIRVVRTHATKALNGAQVCFGDVEVTRQVVGYWKRLTPQGTVRGGENLAEVSLQLPPHVFPTTAVWFDLPPDAHKRAVRERVDLPGGLHAMEHAAIGVLPLFALCDRNDIGGVSTTDHSDTGKPQVFIHDGHPGGVGIAEHAYAVIEDLLAATLGAIEECRCRSGCPSCIQSPKCGNNNYPLDKHVAASLLRALLGKRPKGMRSATLTDQPCAGLCGVSLTGCAVLCSPAWASCRCARSTCDGRVCRAGHGQPE